ncbi:MAG: BatA domain-containing protein [Chloroflexota bacterium]
MGLLFPFALGLLALALPIIIFYLLKVRREELTVSSNFLWRKVIEDKQANAPWQKLQKNWLLFLQLLLLLLLVLVLGRPFYASEAQATGNIIVLLDGSAGMQATDVAPNRFTKAKEEVKSIISGMGGNDQMTIVLMRSFPEVLTSNSTNKNELNAALDRAKVSNEPANARAALILAAASADRTPGTTVVFASSGAFARDEDLPPLKARLKLLKVGQSDANQAITALRLRESGGGPQLFIGLNNYSTTPARIQLQVLVDGKSFDTREIQIGGGEKADLTLTDLPLTTRLVDARLKPVGNSQDFLALDNEAWTIRNAGTPQRVLLVTPGNTFLETILSRLPNYKLTKISPDEYEPLKSKESYNLMILDSFMPTSLPTNSLLLINAPNTPFLPSSGTINLPTFARLEQTDPILRYTDLSDVALSKAQKYTLPEWARVVAADSSGAALIFAGDPQGQRVLGLAFDLHDSDLGVKVSWPILLINILSWLQPQGALDQVTELNPGEPVSFTAGSPTEQLSVQPPQGGAQTLTQNKGIASFTDTQFTGVYTLTRRLNLPATATTRATLVTDNFVVNLFSPLASNIKPLDDLGLQGTVTQPSTAKVNSEREFWWPIALGAILVLMAEWWVFYRGFKLPARWSLRKAAK